MWSASNAPIWDFPHWKTIMGVSHQHSFGWVSWHIINETRLLLTHIQSGELYDAINYIIERLRPFNSISFHRGGRGSGDWDGRPLIGRSAAQFPTHPLVSLGQILDPHITPDGTKVIWVVDKRYVNAVHLVLLEHEQLCFLFGHQRTFFSQNVIFTGVTPLNLMNLPWVMVGGTRMLFQGSTDNGRCPVVPAVWVWTSIKGNVRMNIWIFGWMNEWNIISYNLHSTLRSLFLWVHYELMFYSGTTLPTNKADFATLVGLVRGEVSL